MRPHPYRADPTLLTLYVNRATGEVTRQGATKVIDDWGVRPLPLKGILTIAAGAGCRRVFLLGEKPTDADWMDEELPAGWRAGGHYRELRDPCGRYYWRDDTKVTEIRRMASWFGEGDYTVGQARDAMQLLDSWLYRESKGRVNVLASPAATGQSLWASTLSDGQVDEPLSPEVGQLVRSTSPQHREEVVGRCFDGCELHLPAPRSRVDELVYFDAVFMFATCVRELGVGGVRLAGARVAAAHWEASPMARARYLVRFMVPGDWRGPGLLPVKHPNGQNWHYPTRTIEPVETWCDAAELHLAVEQGWPVTIHDGIKYGEGHRPADTFGKMIVRMREKAQEDRTGVEAALIASALRTMFIRTIGGWHSLGRERTYVVPAGEELPAHVERWQTRGDGSRVYKERHELVGNAAAMQRPELSSQVWARARVKVARKMLSVPPSDLVAVWGDALYLGADPGWTGDKPGEFRAKGRLAGPVSRPKTISELLQLRGRMTE